jgi:fucose 4-O-acetylase-like acetyltransferase
MVQAGHLAPGFALDLADRLAYGFHVQVFFLVSGYFLADRVRTWADFAPRAVNLYWPYLLWSGISGVLLLLVPGANNTITLRQFVLLPVIPLQHFWFLLYLIGCIALMVLARGRVALMTGAFLALNLAALAADLPPDTLGVTIDNATYWPAFFFAGALLARWGGFPPVRAGWFVPAVVVALGAHGSACAAGSTFAGACLRRSACAHVMRCYAWRLGPTAGCWPFSGVIRCRSISFMSWSDRSCARWCSSWRPVRRWCR